MSGKKVQKHSKSRTCVCDAALISGGEVEKKRWFLRAK